MRKCPAASTKCPVHRLNPFLPHPCRRSTSKGETADKKAFYKKIFREASKQIDKVSVRGLVEAFGQTEDKQAPLLSVPGGDTVPALMPRKGKQLHLDAAVWKYYTSAGSPGLTGCGTTAGGRASRRTPAATARAEDEAVNITLKAYGALGKGNMNAKELLKEKALKVR